MQLDLSDDDVEMLREVLDSAAERMTSEIRHTDNRVFRQNLKDRRDRLRSLVAVLGGQQQAWLVPAGRRAGRRVTNCVATGPHVRTTRQAHPRSAWLIRAACRARW